MRRPPGGKRKRHERANARSVVSGRSQDPWCGCLIDLIVIKRDAVTGSSGQPTRVDPCRSTRSELSPTAWSGNWGRRQQHLGRHRSSCWFPLCSRRARRMGAPHSMLSNPREIAKNKGGKKIKAFVRLNGDRSTLPQPASLWTVRFVSSRWRRVGKSQRGPLSASVLARCFQVETPTPKGEAPPSSPLLPPVSTSQVSSDETR